MPLSQLLALPGAANSDVVVRGIQIDSRQVRPGDLFLAVPGECHDGRQFIEQAVANGAVAVLAEPPVSGFVDQLSVPLLEQPELQQDVGVIAARLYAQPSRALHMVGVTGTNGKTTTSWLTAQLARAMGKSCGVIGTLGATLGDDVGEAANTTPDAISLQRQLSEWRDQAVYCACMEVSSHALVQGRVNGVDFESAIFTNLSRDHLDYHGTMAAYGRAKMQLFVTEGLGHAIVNLDDDYSTELLSMIGDETRVLTYSASGNKSADVAITEAKFHPGGVTAQLRSPWGKGELSSPLAGEFNLANLAAAISAVALMTDNFPNLLRKVEQLRAVPGRMQLIPNDLGIQLIVDYAHTPDALEHALQALRSHVTGRLITVFGCGGDRDGGKRSIMGRIASDLSERCVVTSDNPRSEDPLSIMRDIELGCSGDYILVVDRAEAIALALSEARAGDCVLVAGKGHEDYQLISGERLHFSDEEQLLLALAKGGTS
ncbi:MAG: UDP-N-acetylmuramoyl-L-alanyl-D-glutamate--2,6-diaminopimelate ligase [Proteobacteria bacterium]|nr:UDP-N-acetylmuramoyl-L-alanyl-D-glutamate--2,6-diaminopimelate ligase [Pseudomonadota bacterium]